MSSLSDSNLKGWFERHGLPWSDVLSKSLSDLGLSCVEELKFLQSERFNHLFAGGNFIVREKAKLARKQLGQEAFSFAKCANDIPLEKEALPVPPVPTKKQISSRAVRKNKLAHDLRKKFISVTVIKTAEEKRKE